MDDVAKTLALVLLLLAKANLFHSENRMVVLKMYPNQAPVRVTRIYNEFKSISRLACANECVMVALCHSAYYRPDTHQCTFLIDYGKELTLKASNGVYFFTKPTPLCMNDYELYRRNDWNASGPRAGIGILEIPVSFVVLHATARVRKNKWPSDCGSPTNCLQTMKAMQHYDMVEKVPKRDDIAPNFFVDGSGRLYEARGWLHDASYMSRTSRGGSQGHGKHVAITLFGDFASSRPSREAWRGLVEFCACAVEQGYITEKYRVLGHSEDFSLVWYCPGTGMLNLIHRWPQID